MNLRKPAGLLFLGILLIAGGAAAQSSLTAWSDFYASVRNDLRSDSYLVQVGAIDRFRAHDGIDAAEYLMKLIQHDKSHPAVLERAAEVLGGFRDERALRLVTEELKRDPAGNRHLLTAYARQEHANWQQVALFALKNATEPSVRVAAVELLAAQPDPDDATVALLIACLGERFHHSVRKSAATAFGRMKSKLVVAPLIEVLPDKVIGAAARDALLRLTALEYWRDQPAWREWWMENEATFVPQPMRDADFALKHAALLKEKGEAAMQADFYEREIEGKNLLFLLDVSGSMADPVKAGGESRIEKLKAELGYLVDRLDEEYRVGLVLFPHDTFPSTGIAPVDEQFRKKAERFIDRMSASGSTPMGHAVEYAFEKIAPKSNVDTIYLLSDGIPTDVSDEDLQEMLLLYIDRFGVTINCISIGMDSVLLKAVASESGGQYWEIK